jgi:hypothetical protein
MAVREETQTTSSVPWLSDADYDDTLKRVIDGHGAALHLLLFGPVE